MMNKLTFFLLFLFAAGPAWCRCLGVMSAMPQELKVLQHKLGNARVRTLGSDEFSSGGFAGFPVILTLSGIGKVNAAVAAQRLVSEFNCSAIFFFGVAGAADEDLNIGDIVVADQAFQHDFGFSGKEFVPHAVGTMPELGVGDGKEPLPFASIWKENGGQQDFFVKALIQIGGSIQWRVDIGADETVHPKVVRGVIGTGDQFIASEDKRSAIHKLGASAIEMEGAAVAQVATKNKIPFVLIRAISDKAKATSKVDFPKFVAAVSANNAQFFDAILKDKKVSKYLRDGYLR